ncbi:MAG: APC family permease [Methanoculleaceae archaeon]
MTGERSRTMMVPLKRTLTLPMVTLSGVGVILGAGIYALIGEAASTSGNALWLSFLLSATIAAFTGLSYAELSSMFPSAGAEYDYTAISSGPAPAFVVGMMVILSGIIGGTTVALGFAGYFVRFFPMPYHLTAALLIILLGVVALLGIRQSTALAIAFTLIESGGLVGIIAIGLPYIGSVDYLEMPYGWPGIFQAAALLFFAYQGFEEIVKLSEETFNPEKTIPAGLLLALSFTIVIYVLVAISVVSIGGWQSIAGSQNPFAEMAGAVLGESGFTLFTFIALFATANTVLLMLLSASRIMYSMARSQILPGVLAYVHPRLRTPVYATILVMVVSVLFLLAGDIREVAQMANFTLFFTYAIINAAVIMLRFRGPEIPRPFRVPGAIRNIPIIPVLGIASCLFFLIHIDRSVLLMGTILLIALSIIAIHAKRQN